MYLDEWLMQEWLWGLPICILISYVFFMVLFTFIGWWVYTRTKYQWYYYVIAIVMFAIFVNNVIGIHIPLVADIVDGLTGGG